MKKHILALSLCCLVLQALSAQNLISSTFKGSKTVSQLSAQFNFPFIQYNVKYYKVTYSSPDAKGNLDTLSGLLAVPSDQSKSFPRLVYQHGTSDCKTCVPSRYGSTGGDEGQIALLFAGMGYVALLPDYVGMGDGRGFQAYVHAATEASAAADMVRASNAWLSQNQYHANNQLFVTGYSQGGHGSMAFHHAVETNLSNEMTMTAAAHLSGPYSISGVMRNLILSPAVYQYPAYIPNTALSYQNVYGNLYNNLTDIFRQPYAGFIQQYRDGVISLGTLNSNLIQALTTEYGASIPRNMIRDSALMVIQNDLAHPVNQAFRDNDLYNWAPQAPTRIFYCTADDQVPYLNSVVARDTMLANGAPNLVVTDVNTTADHGGCVVPALTNTLLFFGGFQQITTASNEPLEALDISIAPNPVQNQLFVSNVPAGARIGLYDWSGRLRRSVEHMTGSSVMLETGDLPAGIYFLQAQSVDGRKVVMQVAVCR